jgi:hypothetical protein
VISTKIALVTIRDIIYIPTMGRKQINHEQTPARFPEGTLDRMDAVLEEDENRSTFIRTAVERLLKLRERAGKRAK